MKLVKFNVVTEFHNIPDEKFKMEVENMEKLEDEDWEKFAKKLSSSRNKYPYVTVKIGDEIAVPDWYYEHHKNDIVDITVYIDKYVSDNGQLIPFDMKDAIKHGYVKDFQSTMHKVKRFELIKEMTKINRNS